MELQTGIDLIEIGRIQKSLRSPRFLQRVFSSEERALFVQRGGNPQTVAANFAAKEAFAKAVGTGVRGFALDEVALLRDQFGKPYFHLSGRALALVETHQWTLAVSVTHTREYASAVVVCYGGNAR